MLPRWLVDGALPRSARMLPRPLPVPTDERLSVVPAGRPVRMLPRDALGALLRTCELGDALRVMLLRLELGELIRLE